MSGCRSSNRATSTNPGARLSSMRHKDPMTTPGSDTASNAVVESAMRRALVLAARGPATGRIRKSAASSFGNPAPRSPKDGIAGGTPHAEVDALAKLSAGQARGATAVVTLEPCNHIGHTGPCSEALIAEGSPASSTPCTTPTRSPRAARNDCAGRRRRCRRDVRAMLSATPSGMARSDAARPTPRHPEVGIQLGRPSRGIRRLKPVDHLRSGTRARAPAARAR